MPSNKIYEENIRSTEELSIEVKELLLRIAVTETRRYATDILVFLESEKIKKLLRSEADIYVYFQKSSIHWDVRKMKELEDGKHRKKLILKCIESTLTIEEEEGRF